MESLEWREVPEFRDEDADGEDQREWDDYNTEKALMEFRDEDHVLHSMYPETDDEEAGTQCTMVVPKPAGAQRGGTQRGQVFFNEVAFKESVLDYALKTV
ncbi:hypothetical protein EUTSA_v10015932mg [Eutrema salsugineum]|uniref:Uncharacterized protein n=1 Tax=Eutrema salsugineum TaxID=72664 RepID=V4KZX1_EUTSA|nr:hypothetical protein EUTSA_v10015932mg [Eutrema salsugineum]